MRYHLKGLALTLAASFVLYGCGKEEPPPPPPKAEQPPAPPPKPTISVKIGHSAPLTGPQSHLGKDNENGALLAIEEANAKNLEIGGAKVKFELMGEDDQADGKQATTIAQRFVDAKVNGVIGHLNSGATIPASKTYSDAGIPQISPSATSPKYTDQGFKTAYRVMANDAKQGPALGQFALNTLKIKSVAIIDDRTSYGQGLADQFEATVKSGGANVVAREFTSDKATDFAAILTKVKAKKPDVVFFAGMDPQAGPMAQQMKKLGIKSKLLMGDGGCTAEFPKLAGDAAEGHYCSLPGVPLEKMPGGMAFKDKYQARFKDVQIQLYAPYAYDAASVMIDAMKRANSVEPAKYLAELPKTNFSGATGQIQFDDKGDIKDGQVTLYQFKAGNKEPIETIGGAPAAAPAPDAKATEAKPADAAKPAEALKAEAKPAEAKPAAPAAAAPAAAAPAPAAPAKPAEKK
jgi:branched-chain amino acid transport system substrate-binding protein